MNTISISVKTEMLREEIKQILFQERLYQQAKPHSVFDRTAHNARELRLMEIRDELAKLQGEASPIRDDRDEATPVMVPFRRSPARFFPVVPHHRLGVLPLRSP